MCMPTKITKQRDFVKINTISKESIFATMKQSNINVTEEALVSRDGYENCTTRGPLNQQPEQDKPSNIMQGNPCPAKCVTFSHQARMRRVSSWRNYSDEELEATWYTDDEYKQIRNGCCQDVLKLDRGEEITCPRGLECHTKKGRSARNKNKAKSFVAVLEEQEAQWEAEEEGGSACVGDDDAIAFVYSEVSRPCQLAAHNAGLADWHEVVGYYSSDGNTDKKPKCPKRNHVVKPSDLPKQTLSPTPRPNPQCSWAKTA